MLRDERRGQFLIGMVVALFVLMAVVKLVPAFQRLVFQDIDKLGAVDLRLRWNETKAWFAGYRVKGNVYPAASFAMFWPLMGWLSLAQTRVLWVPLYLGSLGWLSRLCMRECSPATPRGRVAAALLPWALTSSAVTISIGQLGLFTLPAAIAFALVLARGTNSVRNDLRAGALFVASAMKPTIAAPFAWLLIALSRRLRPGAIASAVYGGLSALALSFLIPERVRPDESAVLLPDTFRQFGSNEEPLKVAQGFFLQGYGNLQNLAVNAGLNAYQSFVLPMVAVLACGAWAWRRRHADVWILLAVCGLVARMSFYHRLYDDLLALPAIVALARIAASRAKASVEGLDDGTAIVARLLLVACATAGCMPGYLMIHLPVTHAFATGSWLATLWFLVRFAASPDSMDLGLEPRPEPAR